MFYKANYFFTYDPEVLLKDRTNLWLTQIGEKNRSIINLFTKVTPTPMRLRTHRYGKLGHSRLTAYSDARGGPVDGPALELVQEAAGVRLRIVGARWSCQVICQPKAGAEVMSLEALEKGATDLVFFYDAKDKEKQDAREAWVRKIVEENRTKQKQTKK